MLVLAIIVVLIAGSFIYVNYFAPSAQKTDEGIIPKDKGADAAKNLTVKTGEKPFSEWNDICVESVKAIAVGNTKPFSPWSPDGEWITYSNWYTAPELKDLKFTVDEPMGVYVIKYDGTSKRFIGPGGARPSFGRYQWQIIYSKNGTSGKSGYKNGSEEDLWIVNFDGTENKPVFAGEEDCKMKNYGGSSITYDGKHVVCNVLKDGPGGGVGIIDINGSINGSGGKMLVIGSGVWGYSKDGTKVFIEAVETVKKGYLTGGWMNIADFGVNTETGEGTEKVGWVTKLEYPANHYGHPHVNFDGTMIAYDNPDVDVAPLEKRNIWIGLLDGSNKNEKLTDYGETGEFGNHPRWSPDGKWLVYDQQKFIDEGVKDKVMIINIETKKKKEIYGLIAPRHSGWTEPGWSPDGKKIFFYGPDSDNGNKQSVWIAVLKEC